MARGVLTVFENHNDRSRSWIHRIEPVDKCEENEQLKLALSASYAEVGHNENAQFGQTPESIQSSYCLSSEAFSSTSTASGSTSRASVSTSTSPSSNVNDAATTLLSLRKSYMNTDHEVHGDVLNKS